MWKYSIYYQQSPRFLSAAEILVIWSSSATKPWYDINCHYFIVYSPPLGLQLTWKWLEQCSQSIAVPLKQFWCRKNSAKLDHSTYLKKKDLIYKGKCTFLKFTVIAEEVHGVPSPSYRLLHQLLLLCFQAFTLVVVDAGHPSFESPLNIITVCYLYSIE